MGPPRLTPGKVPLRSAAQDQLGNDFRSDRGQGQAGAIVPGGGDQPPGGLLGGEGPPGGGEQPGGQPDGGQHGQRPDLAAVAEELGVTEQALLEALGDPSDGPPDLAAAAQALGVTEEDLQAASDEGKAIKLVATAQRQESGTYQLTVVPTPLPASHPLAQLSGQQMGVVYHTDIYGTISAANLEEEPVPSAFSRYISYFPPLGKAPGFSTMVEFTMAISLMSSYP